MTLPLPPSMDCARPPPHATLAPSAWIERWCHLIAPGGRVLDVACGSGRHLACLQDQGLKVLGVDRDTQVLKRLKTFGYNVFVADLEQGAWPFAPESLDAVVVTHYLWRPLWPDLKAVLRPHGVILCETFSTGHEVHGRPKNPDFLLRSGELLEVFRDFHTIAFEEGFEPHPPRLVQRLVAQKPMDNANRPTSALRPLE